AAIKAGLDVDQFAPRLSFFFNAHSNFLEEVAKFRAARRMWAHIMRERFKAKNPRSWMLRFHTQTAGSTLTAQQPENNIVRTALQALSAVLGGTQSLHTNGYDEALAVGVNRFTIKEEKPIPLQRIDEALERKQVERVRAVRAKRDAKTWESALKRVEEAARGGENLMPRIVEAIEACATVGEIS